MERSKKDTMACGLQKNLILSLGQTAMMWDSPLYGGIPLGKLWLPMSEKSALDLQEGRT